MKQFIKTSIAAAALVMSGMANATVIETTFAHSAQNLNQSNVVDNTGYKLFFDITTKGYEVLVDKVTSATLNFSFKDSGANNDSNVESFSILFNLNEIGTSGGVINVPNGGASYGPFSVTGASLTALSTTGTLELLLKAGSGSFTFFDSTLTANVTEGQVVTQPGSVPEPLSMALMGIGLAGLAASRRKA